MKDLIVLIASLLILLTFPLQYVQEQYNYQKKCLVQKYVNNAKEKARVKGRFTDEIINELKTNLLTTFKDIDESEIIINVTTTPKYRINEFNERELIYYDIEIPIKKIIAANKFWGIDANSNKANYIIKGYTSSELIMP